MDLHSGESRQLTQAEALDPETLTLGHDERTFCFFDGAALRQHGLGGSRDREVYRIPEGWQRGAGASVTGDGLSAIFAEVKERSSRIRLIGLLKSGAATVVETPFPAAYPVSRPKRAQILYRQGDEALWLVNFDGAQNRRLKIAPDGRIGGPPFDRRGRDIDFGRERDRVLLETDSQRVHAVVRADLREGRHVGAWRCFAGGARREGRDGKAPRDAEERRPSRHDISWPSPRWPEALRELLARIGHATNPRGRTAGSVPGPVAGLALASPADLSPSPGAPEVSASGGGRSSAANSKGGLESCRVVDVDRRALVCVVAASLLVGNVGLVAAQTREAAVESARRGEYDTAISSLRALAQAAPSDTGVRFDLAVVLQWAGRSREATDVFETTRSTEAPEYVLSAMTRAYRDQQRWTDAGRLAAEGGRRFPQNAEWPLAVRLAEAGAALGAGDSYGALRAYLTAQLLAPDDDRLRREVSGILVQVGAPFAAGLHAEGRDPGIEARQAAALVNQATAIPAMDPVHRFDRIDAALTRLESLLADARAAAPPDEGLIIRLRGDRVAALRDHERWPEVVAEVAAAVRLDEASAPNPHFTVKDTFELHSRRGTIATPASR
jgi:tetratricopeptide (TPR) repeat protein